MRGLIRTATLLNSSLDLPEILKTALDTAARVMEAEAASVLLVDPATGELLYEAVREAEDPSLRGRMDEVSRTYRIPRGVGIAGWVAERGEPLNVPDAYQDPRFNQEVDRRSGFRTRSILAMPLRTDGAVIGVAEVINRKDGEPFDREDLVLFRHFCDIAAVAIQKARLHREHLEKEALEMELAVAGEIQGAFLPRILPETPGYRLGHAYSSARSVGGDFFDAMSLEGGRLAVVVGDVSGKGCSAALLGASVASDLRILLRRGLPLHDLTSRMNRIVAERSTRGMFVTLLIATLDPESGRGAFTSAGHLPPLLYEADRGEARLIAGGAGPPAGVVPGVVYEETELALAPGDRLILYTDGIAEAMDPEREPFGTERLLRLVEREGRGGATLEGPVLEAAREHARGAPQHDDLTYVELFRLPG
jgi:sigma-B regulation protein RsbU (phosphoserine phosphatase)